MRLRSPAFSAGAPAFWLRSAFPRTLWNITAGQNGFLTAALIGGTLGLMEKRPALAGVCLGLLTYKPQFGLLFPLALIADRRWQTIAVAAFVAVSLAVLSWLAFGSASWQAFVHWMPITSRVVLDEGHADWSRLQSLFGLVRSYGGSEQLAWTMQAAGSLAVAVRSPACGAAARLSTLKPRRSPPARSSLRLISICTIWSCSRSRWRFLLRFALEHGFRPARSPDLAPPGVILIFP